MLFLCVCSHAITDAIISTVFTTTGTPVSITPVTITKSTYTTGNYTIYNIHIIVHCSYGNLSDGFVPSHKTDIQLYWDQLFS